MNPPRKLPPMFRRRSPASETASLPPLPMARTLPNRPSPAAKRNIQRYAPSRADRQIANASTSHCTAFTVLGSGSGTQFSAESWRELCNLFILNAQSDVVDLREQACFRFGKGRADVHYFDALATLRCGKVIAYTVKPKSRVNRPLKRDTPHQSFLERMQEITWMALHLRFADEVRLITEEDLDPVVLHNARIFAAVREPDPEADAFVRDAIGALVGGCSIRDLTAWIGMKERGYRAILRLVRSGELRFQAGHRITPTTVVYRKL